MHDLTPTTAQSLEDTTFLFSYIGNLNTIRNCRIFRVKGGPLASSGPKIRTSVGVVSMDFNGSDSNSRMIQLKTYLTDDDDKITAAIEQTDDLGYPNSCFVNRFVDLPFSFPGLHFRIPINEWVWRVRHTGPAQDNPKLL